MDQRKRWIEIITLLFVLSMGISLSLGCSSSDAASCNTVDDCFDGEVCHEAICQPADEVDENSDPGNAEESDAGQQDANGALSGDEDASSDEDVSTEDTNTGETGTEDIGGEDTGSNDENDEPGEVCEPEFACDHGIEDIHQHAGGHFINWVEPDDEEDDHFGCRSSGEFIELEQKVFTARACPGEQYRHRVRASTCGDRTFVIDYTLKSLVDACPLDDENVELSFHPHYPACDHGEEITTECHLVEQLDDGSHRWRAVFESVSSTKGVDPGFRMQVDPEASFDYEVTMTVTDDFEPW